MRPPRARLQRHCTRQSHGAATLNGYAFRAIDGTGILVHASTGTVIESNRVIEERLLPTTEAKTQYGVGELTVRPAEKDKLMSREARTPVT